MVVKIVLWPGNKRKDGKQAIKVKVSAYNKSKYYPLGIFVKPENFVSGVVTSNDPHYRIYNQQITAASEKIEDLKIKNHRLDADSIIKLFAEKPLKQVTLLSFIESFILDCRTRKLRLYNTTKGYMVTLNALKKFVKEVRPVDFNDIDLRFYKDFTAYCANELNFSINTIGTKIKHLKLFLNEANEDGIVTNQEYKSKKFKIVKEETEAIALTPDEVNKMYEHDFKDMPEMDKERDRFILTCCIGLRFSDSVRIKPEHVQNNYLNITTEKTGEKVIIPLNKMAYEILKKYNFNCPSKTTNQHSNRTIKKVGKEVGFTEDILIKQAGKEAVYKKWELIDTHTGRRTFATNAYLAGVDPFVIMKITGHRDLRSFLLYIKIDKLKNAHLAAEHPFFK